MRITVITVLTFLIASCGQQPKTSVTDNVGATLAVAPLAVAQSDAPVPHPINEKEFCQLIQEIIYKMPAAFMPDYLKTEEQRRKTISDLGEDNAQSVFSLFQHHDGGYDQWTIAGYLTDDNRNVLLIVQYGSGLDGFQLKSDRTLNYSIETEEFTEMERPIKLPAVDEIILESVFGTDRLFQRAKTHFGNKMEFNYGNFYKEGFTVIPNYFYFWDNNSDFDYYGAPYMLAWYKWDGKQFYKYKILNYDDFGNEYLTESGESRDEYTGSPQTPADILKILKGVLTDETAHIDAEKNHNIFLKDYLKEKNATETEMRFAIVDLDGDGIPEAVIEHLPGEVRVLRYETGKVYGFTFGFRGMNGIKKDGSFAWSNSAFNSGIGRQTFYETNTGWIKIAEESSEPDAEENYHVYYSRVTKQQYEAFQAVHNAKEDVVWTPFTADNINSLKEWDELQFYYAGIPDRMFPVPMLQGVIIPYKGFSPPEEGWIKTTYSYEDTGFTESYKQQLRGAGFVEQEGAPEGMESLWRYDRSSDGASLFVELLHEEGRFVISMYVNYLNN